MPGRHIHYVQGPFTTRQVVNIWLQLLIYAQHCTLFANAKSSYMVTTTLVCCPSDDSRNVIYLYRFSNHPLPALKLHLTTQFCNITLISSTHHSFLSRCTSRTPFLSRPTLSIQQLCVAAAEAGLSSVVLSAARYLEAPCTVARWYMAVVVTGMAVVLDITIDRWVSTAGGTASTAIGRVIWSVHPCRLQP